MSFDRCVFGPLFGVTYDNQFFSICVRIFVGVDLRLRGPAAGRVALAGPNGMVVGARLGGADCNIWPIRCPSAPVGHF